MGSASRLQDAGGKWITKHLLARSHLGVSPQFRPWTQPPAGTSVPELRGVPDNPRYRDCIDIAWAVALQKPEAQRLPLYCNFTQCPSRAPWSQKLRCLTTSTKYYDFQRDTVICPEETLMLQGHPATDLRLGMFSKSTLVHAVGEAMSCPCVGAIILGMYLNSRAPWWATEDSEI